MAEKVINVLRIESTSKYDDKTVTDILTVLSESIETRNQVVLTANELKPIVFALLKSVGTSSRVDPKNRIIVEVDGTEIPISVADITSAITRKDNSLTARGFAKALSTTKEIAERIDSDITRLSKTATLNVSDSSLNFPGGCLLKRLKGKVSASVSQYYLSDVFDESIVPSDIIEIIKKFTNIS
jgi:hypothetical protein